MICPHCKAAPVLPPQKNYCSVTCYRKAKRLREKLKKRALKTPPAPPVNMMIRCMGPCGRMFESEDRIYNRICPKCKIVIGHMVEINGEIA